MRKTKGILTTLLMSLVLTGQAEEAKVASHHAMSGSTPIMTNVQNWVENYDVVPLGIVTFGVSNNCVYVSDGTNSYVVARTWDALNIGLETVTNRYGFILSGNQSFESLNITNVPVNLFVCDNDNYPYKNSFLKVVPVVSIGTNNDISACQYGLVCGSNCVVATYASAYGEMCEARGLYSNAEGTYNSVEAEASHVEGVCNTIIEDGARSHAEGGYHIVETMDSHMEGTANWASGTGHNIHMEGFANDVCSSNSLGKLNEKPIHCAGCLNSVVVGKDVTYESYSIEGIQNSTDIIGYGIKVEGMDNVVTNCVISGTRNSAIYLHVLGCSNLVHYGRGTVYGRQHLFPLEVATEWIDHTNGYHVVVGVGCRPFKHEEYGFTYNGDSTIADMKYTAPAESAFSINPAGGTNGFYVAEMAIGKLMNMSFKTPYVEDLELPSGMGFNRCLKDVIEELGGEVETMQSWVWSE